MSDRAPTTSRLEEALHAGDLLDPRFSLYWERCTDYPVASWNAQPVWFNGKLYLRAGGGIVGTALLSVYTPSEDSWEVIDTPTKYYALATYHSQLLLVGGGDRYTSSRAHSVWVLEDDHWVPHPTILRLSVDCSVLNAVEFGDYLIVHVRETVFYHTTTLMVWNGQRWFTVEGPQLQSAQVSWRSSYAVSGDDWYLTNEVEVYRTSLQSVVASALNQSVQPAPVWEKLPDPPCRYSGITWFGGHLLSVGGYSQQTLINESAIHAYDQQARSWEQVSDFPGDGHHGSSCAALPTGELLVVEGSRVLKATIRVAGEASSSKSTIKVLHTAVAELGHKRNKTKVQKAMDALAALDERDTAKESEHLKLTPTPLTASKTEVIDSKAPLNLKKERAARKRFYLEQSLELPKVLEAENAMQLQEMAKLLPPDLTPELPPDTKPLVKQEFPVKQEYPVKQEFQVKQEYKQEPMTIAVPTSARYLPTVRGSGVEAIADIHLLVTNSGRSFHWEGYGLKLTFPPHCLPPGLDEYLLRIQASTSGQYQFPDDSLLVSGVYAISCSSEVTFTRPATLELQHCSEHDNELSFAVAKTSKGVPPYKFSRCKGAVFSKLSAYGTLEVHSFSLFAIIANGFSSLGRILSPRCYCGNIYKARSAESPNVWSVYFIITQNLDVHRKSAAAFASEKNASHHHELTLQFKGDSVCLDTRESNLTDWEISACKPIMITRAEVDDFRHGRRVPHCHLEVEWTGSGRVGKLKHDVAVIGALPEGQSFPICIYPELSAGKRSNEGGEQSQGPRSKRSKEEKLTAVSGATEVVSLSDLNSLSELLVSIAGHWELFLTALGVSVDEQARIKVQYANSPKSATHCLLTGLEGWVKSSDHPTYGDIIEALQGGLVTDKPLASQVERFALQKAHSRAAVAAVARGKDKLVEEASASSSNAATLTDLSYNT